MDNTSVRSSEDAGLLSTSE